MEALAAQLASAHAEVASWQAKFASAEAETARVTAAKDASDAEKGAADARAYAKGYVRRNRTAPPLAAVAVAGAPREKSHFFQW